MRKDEIIWAAGFLEGKGFSIHHNGHKGSNFHISIPMPQRRLYAMERLLAVLNSAKYGRNQEAVAYRHEVTNGFAEAFEHNGRAATFIDARRVRYDIITCGVRAYNILTMLMPYFSKEKQAQYKDALSLWHPARNSPIRGDLVHKIHILRSEGKTLAEIAKYTRVGRTTIKKYLRAGI